MIWINVYHWGWQSSFIWERANHSAGEGKLCDGIGRGIFTLDSSLMARGPVKIVGGIIFESWLYCVGDGFCSYPPPRSAFSSPASSSRY